MLKEIISVHATQQILVGWGSVRGERGIFGGGSFVGLPHLSRFTITTREASQEALRTLLGDALPSLGKCERRAVNAAVSRRASSDQGDADA